MVPDAMHRLVYLCDWLPPDFGAVGQYSLLFAREPRPSEVKAVRDFLAGVRKETSGPSPERAAWTQVALVLLNSNEFVYVP